MLTKSDLQEIKAIVNEAKQEFQNDLIKFKDQILGEIQNLREEITVTTGYRDALEDHEVRIEKLEKNQPKISHV